VSTRAPASRVPIPPCHCGSTEPFWHGPTNGLRTYCCADCWSVDPHNPDRFPEHEKLKAVREKSQAIGEFLDWVNAEKRLCLAGWRGETLFRTNLSTQTLLAAFFDIDEAQVERERLAMLRQMQNGGAR